MAINTNAIGNINTLEALKFVNIVNDTNFPPISVYRTSYDDNLSAVDIYQKSALLVYTVNASASGGGTTPTGSTYTDRSGTIFAPSSAQIIMAPNVARRYIFFLNTSAADMYVNDTTVAVLSSPSIKVPASGGYWEPLVCPLGQLTVICATSGTAYTCKEA